MEMFGSDVGISPGPGVVSPDWEVGEAISGYFRLADAPLTGSEAGGSLIFKNANVSNADVQRMMGMMVHSMARQRGGGSDEDDGGNPDPPQNPLGGDLTHPIF